MISFSQDKSSGTNIQMITELGKECRVPLYCLHISFLLISVAAQEAPLPWHHFEHILPSVLVEIACLVLAPYLKAKFVPFISERITSALIPTEEVLVAVSRASCAGSHSPARGLLHLRPVDMTDAH